MTVSPWQKVTLSAWALYQVRSGQFLEQTGDLSNEMLLGRHKQTGGVCRVYSEDCVRIIQVSLCQNDSTFDLLV